MIESFVDLTYRGLTLAQRVKLTQVRPTTGYLEMPAPMPVGTSIVIATDDGLTLDAVVTAIHEQVGGSDQVPGMIVAPALAEDPKRAWWTARAAVEASSREPAAELAGAHSTSDRVTVRPRSHTVQTPTPTPPPAAEVAGAGAGLARLIATDTAQGGATTVMPSVDPELVEQLTSAAELSDGVPALGQAGQHPIVDDGKRTMVMAAIDPAALDSGASGEHEAVGADDPSPGQTNPGIGDPKKSGTTGGKKRRKRR